MPGSSWRLRPVMASEGTLRVVSLDGVEVSMSRMRVDALESARALARGMTALAANPGGPYRVQRLAWVDVDEPGAVS